MCPVHACKQQLHAHMSSCSLPCPLPDCVQLQSIHHKLNMAFTVGCSVLQPLWQTHMTKQVKRRYGTLTRPVSPRMVVNQQHAKRSAAFPVLDKNEELSAQSKTLSVVSPADGFVFLLVPAGSQVSTLTGLRA